LALAAAGLGEVPGEPGDDPDPAPDPDPDPAPTAVGGLAVAAPSGGAAHPAAARDKAAIVSTGGIRVPFRIALAPLGRWTPSLALALALALPLALARADGEIGAPGP
jgi:hypothetical protein